MEPKWKQCESLLARMANSMGCALKADPENCLVRARWYIVQSGGFPLTVEYYSPVELFDRMLNYYEAFHLCGRIVDNPFYGMSREELELKLAVMGK
jgi:hypothetical protein